MARIRTIKPEFFTSEDVACLPFRTRLTWVGLWTHVDDEGRCKDSAALVAAALWPLDDEVNAPEVEEDLQILAHTGRIVRYEVDGKGYLQVTNWHHQRISRPTRSKFPARPGSEVSVPEPAPAQPPAAPAPAPSSGRPPRKCPQHLGTRNTPPCGACKEAREEADRWVKDQPTLSAKTTTCGIHPEHPALNCPACAEEVLPEAPAGWRNRVGSITKEV